MMTRNTTRNPFGVVCAAVFLGATLAGCSGSGGSGGTTGGGTKIYPSSQVPGTPGTLVDPSHIIKLPGGNVLVSDMVGSHVLKIYDSTGTLVKTIGSGSGVASSAPGEFDAPEGISIGPGGDIYVVDSDNHRVEVFDSTGTYIRQYTAAGMEDPEAIAVTSNGDTYVVDDKANKVFAFHADGTFASAFGDTGAFPLNAPLDIVTDGAGHLFVADANNDRIVVFSVTGSPIAAFGSHGSGDGQLWHPVGLCFDSHGNFYVNDAGNGRVVEFDVNKKFLISYQFRDPKTVTSGQKTSLEGFGINVDASGNIYVVIAGAAYQIAPAI